MQQSSASNWSRISRGLSSVLVVTFFAASGCGGDDENNDGSGGKGGSAGKAGSGNNEAGDMSGLGGSGAEGGGMSEAGAPPEGGSGGSNPQGGMMNGGGGEAGARGLGVCGDGFLDDGEECDDGNTVSGDGCDSLCRSSCEVCEQNWCTDVRTNITTAAAGFENLYANCYEMPGVAPSGPGQGVERAELCRAMVDCVRREKCEQLVSDDAYVAPPGVAPQSVEYAFLRCWCDIDVTVASPSFVSTCSNSATFVEGKCYREIQEASEADAGSEVFRNINALRSPQGAANVLLQHCSKRLCTEECFPQHSSGVVATITADILVAENAAGESPFGDLMADSQRAATNTDFALVNETSFRDLDGWTQLGLLFEPSPGRPADAQGRVLESEVVHAIFGMHHLQTSVNVQAGNRLLTMQLTGQQIYDFMNAKIGGLQVSGMTYTWDALLSQVTEIRKDGTPIDVAASYSVTVNDLLATSLTGATNVVTTDHNPLKQLIAYLKALPQPVAPPALDRVTRLN
jgi:cysteine-rich repeat protein